MKTTLFFFLVGGSLTSATLYQHEAQDLKSARDTGTTVLTSSGPVSGHAASFATSVTEFLGIPYAIPPVGDLRFAPPQKYTGNSSINGTSFGFSCPQITAFNGAGGGSGGVGGGLASVNLTAAGTQLLLEFGQLGDRFSEDCLTLNVWVPSGGAKGKAVLLWIYGGSFQTGSTDVVVYNGQFLAGQEDVIVVSANYRLNIFGFPATPSLVNKNAGLMDQRLAVEWVRDNIVAFGGDPTRITMFGQSAGSASLDFYSYAHASDPIINGYIFESGTIGFGTSPPTDLSASWFSVTSALGCGNSTSDAPTVLSCMRSKPYGALLAAIGDADFEPSIDNITVFSDYPARTLAGNFAKVPLLIGNADYEAGIFIITDALANITHTEAFWTAFDLVGFTCPAGKRANISIANGIPTWRYRWFGNFPNTRLTSVPDSGAWHASELPILFNTTPPSTSTIPASTDAEIAIGTYLRGAWAAFAKDPVNGLTNYGGGWPTYNPTANTLIRLAYNNQTGTNLASPSLYDIGCPNIFAVNVTSNSTGNATSTSAGSGGAASSTSASASPAKTSSSAGVIVTSTWSVLASSWIVVLAMSLCGL